MTGRGTEEIASRERVLLLVAETDTGETGRGALADQGIAIRTCPDIGELCRAIDIGAGAAVLAQERLDESALDLLAETLKRQPRWSELPLVIISSDGRSTTGIWHAIQARPPIANAALLQRPVGSETFVSAVRVALRSRRHQYRLRRQEEHLRLLLGELRQRVRAILASVRWLAANTMHYSGSLEDFYQTFDGRLNALALTQNMLTRSAGEDVELSELVFESLLPYMAGRENDVDINGPDVHLRAQSAQTLGLAMHELVTNALKHGALSESGGRISVGWRVGGPAGDRHLELRWEETGITGIDTHPRRGLGSILIERGVTHELGGSSRLEFEPDGVRCIVDVPLALVQSAETM